jgi:hypothetical protein
MTYTDDPAARPSRVRAAVSFSTDLAERVAWTFLQAFGATLVASGGLDMTGVTDMSIWQKAMLAGVAGVLALVKGLVAKQVGDKTSAALLP